MKPSINETNSFFEIARLFPKIFVLCIDERCNRHHSGFWPDDIQKRVNVYDGRDLHIHFKQLDLLRIKENGRPYHKLINTLFFSYFIMIANKEKLSQVLYLEDDLTPISVFPYHVIELEKSLKYEKWELLRFGANFPVDNLHCPERCTCLEFGEMNEYLCSTEYQKINYNDRNNLNYIESLHDDELLKHSCDLRSSIGLAVHHSAYLDIIKMYYYILFIMNHRIHELCNENVYINQIYNNKLTGWLKEQPYKPSQLQSSNININNNNHDLIVRDDFYELDIDMTGHAFNYTKCYEHRYSGDSEPDWQIFYREVPWLDIWISSSFKNVFFTPAILTQKNMDNIGIEFSEACYQPKNHTHSSSSIKHNEKHHNLDHEIL